MNFFLMSAEPHSDFLKIIWDPRNIGNSVVSKNSVIIDDSFKTENGYNSPKYWSRIDITHHWGRVLFRVCSCV